MSKDLTHQHQVKFYTWVCLFAVASKVRTLRLSKGAQRSFKWEREMIKDSRHQQELKYYF